MICINFQIHNLYIDVSVCSEKSCGLEFFKIKLQSLIYNIVCYIGKYKLHMPMQ